jgi:hypothetical protein
MECLADEGLAREHAGGQSVNVAALHPRFIWTDDADLQITRLAIQYHYRDSRARRV